MPGFIERAGDLSVIPCNSQYLNLLHDLGRIAKSVVDSCGEWYGKILTCATRPPHVQTGLASITVALDCDVFDQEPQHAFSVLGGDHS
jgi:hypothetical protein